MVDDSDPHGLGGWTWKACTEMVLLTGGNTKDGIFPASKYSHNDLVEYCEYKFSIQPRPSWIPYLLRLKNALHLLNEDHFLLLQSIYRVLKHFGSNIIFFNGLRDPMSGGGVLKDISKSLVAIVARVGAHHADLRYSTAEDPKWLRQVRKQEVDIISKWLSEYYVTLLDPDSSI